jgi:hypothetical protein
MAYQGGPFLEVLSNAGTNPLANTRISNKTSITRVFDKTVKSYVVQVDGSMQNRFSLPAQENKGMGLIQRFLCFQVYAAAGASLYFEFAVLDAKGAKRRLLFSTAFAKLHQSPLHTQVPLGDTVVRGVWNNLCFDMVDLFPICAGGLSYQCTDGITVGPAIKIRKIFTLRDDPRLDFPRSLQFMPTIPSVIQMINRMSLGLDPAGAAQAAASASSQGTSNSGYSSSASATSAVPHSGGSSLGIHGHGAAAPVGGGGAAGTATGTGTRKTQAAAGPQLQVESSKVKVHAAAGPTPLPSTTAATSASSAASSSNHHAIGGVSGSQNMQSARTSGGHGHASVGVTRHEPAVDSVTIKPKQSALELLHQKVLYDSRYQTPEPELLDSEEDDEGDEDEEVEDSELEEDEEGHEPEVYNANKYVESSDSEDGMGGRRSHRLRPRSPEDEDGQREEEDHGDHDEDVYRDMDEEGLDDSDNEYEPRQMQVHHVDHGRHDDLEEEHDDLIAAVKDANLGGSRASSAARVHSARGNVGDSMSSQPSHGGYAHHDEEEESYEEEDGFSFAMKQEEHDDDTYGLGLRESSVNESVYREHDEEDDDHPRLPQSARHAVSDHDHHDGEDDEVQHTIHHDDEHQHDHDHGDESGAADAEEPGVSDSFVRTIEDIGSRYDAHDDAVVVQGTIEGHDSLQSEDEHHHEDDSSPALADDTMDDAPTLPPASEPTTEPAAETETGDEEKELIYDAVLQCYYDPKTGQYYDSKP